MINPLVSVIIPTHNRANYAVPTIRSVLSISSDIEVIVSDTSEHDRISEHFVDDPAWSRVRLVRPPSPLSVVDNFSEGLRQANGDYLLFLGDDDFVTSKLIDLLVWAKRNKVDAIQFSFPAHYYWPDFKHKRRGDHYSGTLHLGKFSGSVSRHDAKSALLAAAENLGGGVFDMPRAYAGIVSRALTDSIVAKHGSLFGGVSPDIYSAALIADSATHCIRIDYPVIIPGSSGASTAGQSANGKHVGGLRDNAHIGAFKNLVWDELVPEFYSVPTVWGYSLLRALERTETHTSPNYGRLYVRCLFYHRAYWGTSFASIRAASRKVGSLQMARLLARGGSAEIRWITLKLLTMIRVRFRPTADRVFHEIPDTNAACKKVTEILLGSSPSLHIPSELLPSETIE